MILSEKQLGITRREKEKLEQALASLRASNDAGNSVRQAEIDALEAQIEEMETLMSEYVQLKRGGIVAGKFRSFDDFSTALVQARIVSGMSQTDLGAALGVKPQQIQRYESTRYMGASLARLMEVARILKLKVVTEYKLSWFRRWR
ncbi:MAG: helix-turn-helix domain-containing protein [Gammaproteobacteria bacterium]|nr:helix-turn-helix domain-containing protein [Gammaproteobacteria bacterium]MCY4277612.1 helix-turn-helix domain-containing protein [Gammaproteobacteria bacterium]MCY4324057.1 helix-turn-helix domain-containing protein [Gammaproteobacteria bacterium]